MKNNFYDRRQSSHSLVDHHWHAMQPTDGAYPLYITVKWGFVFFESHGTYRATIVGPRTLPFQVMLKGNEYIWGIVLHGDVQLKDHVKRDLLNKVVNLDISSDGELTIAGVTFKVPEYGLLDDFVARLVTSGVLYGAPIAAVSHRDKQRKIKRYTGLSPKQREQASRVDEALLLMDAPMTLAEIASRTGFSDQPHMNRDFVRLVGHTPAEIRKIFADES